MTLAEKINLILLIVTFLWSIISFFANRNEIRKQNLELEKIKKYNSNESRLTQLEIDYQFEAYKELNKYVSFLFRATMDLQPTEALEDNSSEEELNEMYMKMYGTAISAHGRFMDELYTRTPFIDKRVVKEFFMLAFACYENIEYFLEIKDKLCKRTYKNDRQYQKYTENLEDILQKQQKLNNFIYTYIKWQKSCLRNGTDIRDAEIVRFPNIEDYFENLM